MMKYYLSSAKQHQIFIKKDGEIAIELILMIKLMNTTGVYQLNNKRDLWLLSYRTYIIYGMYISFDELFLDEVFFLTKYNRYYNDIEFINFMLLTINSENMIVIQTADLPIFIGLKSKLKKNKSNKKFEQELILKARKFWSYNKNLILFPGTPRDRHLRKELINGEKLSQSKIKLAIKWADLVTKYL